ncbi:MAG: DUF1800 family protein, partial [Lewinella sp.]|nr:DUF1800 family protein [Lewinella sp.]
IFRRGQHDFGEKTFFGRTGNWNGEDIVDMILERRETADFLVRKIWDYFVSAPPEPALLQDLSRSYYEDDYHTGRLLRRIFTSDWFYTSRFRGAQIKAPVVLVAGLVRQLGVRLDDERVFLLLQRTLGQQLFNPPNVAGWPGGRSWIDNATLSQRLSLPAGLLTDREVDLSYRLAPEEELLTGGGQRRLRASLELAPFVAWLGNRPAAEAYEQLCQTLLPTPPRLATELASAMAESDDPEEQVRRLLLIVMTMPEYQLC